jgi:serralysin
MFGGGGNDRMIGGSGDDRMNGGAGADKFIFSTGFGSDRIKRFQDDIDTLRFDDAIWGGGLTKSQMLDTYATDTGSNIRFDFGDGNILVVEGVANVSDLLDDINFF